jgi:hypothetical protein
MLGGLAVGALVGGAYGFFVSETGGPVGAIAGALIGPIPGLILGLVVGLTFAFVAWLSGAR